MSESRIEHYSFRIQSRDASHSIVTFSAPVFRVEERKIMEERIVRECLSYPGKDAFDLEGYES